MVQALQGLIKELGEDRSLDLQKQLRRRIEALDRLDAYLEHVLPPALAAETYQQARKLYARFEAVNSAYYQSIRRDILRGAGRDALFQLVSSEHTAGFAKGEGYDYLDDLVSGVLQFETPEAGVVQLPAEMVLYQPTPARHIFDLIGRIGFAEEDVLVDLGSGLGHVPLLASICAGVRSIGIELAAVYVDCARRSAEALDLKRVSFFQQDAREADLSSGTVFYLYTPFTGSILRSVLDALRQQAASREIRICSFGPCTPVLAKEPWLEPAGTCEEDRIAIFRCQRC